MKKVNIENLYVKLKYLQKVNIYSNIFL